MVGGPVHRRRGAGVCRRRGGAFRARPECWGDDSLAARGGRRGQALPRRRSRGPPLDVHAEVTTRKVDPLNELRQRKYEAGHGDAEAFNRQHAKGKLTARERISRLVDRNSFEEIDLFARHSGGVPGDGVVTGLAKIDGRDVMLFSHDASVFGGSLGEVFAEKVIKVTTGENVTFDSLGGAEVHNVKSGVGSFLAESEEECFAQVRKLFKYIPQSCEDQPPALAPSDDPDRAAPGLATIIPDNPKEPYDIKDVITMVVDRGDFLEVQPFYAMNIVVGFAHLDGKPVGVVANQPKVMAGALDINASDKGARFVRFCDAFNIPLVTFVDVPGFLPGTSQEYGGIIRHGAKLLYAFSEATVAKLTVITRKAYGGAYCVMCSKHIRADFNVAWPTAEIAVMGPEGAVNVVFRRELEDAKDQAGRRAELVSDYTERFANPYIAAERGYIDDVIEPRETRRELIRALRVALRKERVRPPRRHGNIPL